MHSPGTALRCHTEEAVETQPDHDRWPMLWTGAWPQTPDEFAALVEAFADRLVRYAFRQVGSLEDAEDMVQEVLLRAFADRSKRTQTSTVGPYLYRSVANACTDLLRRRNRAPAFREDFDTERLSGLGDDPAQVVQAAEDLRRAEALLRQLPEEQAEVVRLRVLDELRLSEIAEIVGCPVNTVCSRLRYGFQKLRGLMAAQRE